MKYRLLILFLAGYVLLWTLPPTEFSFNQSSQQCFYFVQSASLDGVSLTEGDWIGAFKDETCVGSAQWSGENTTIPVMGDDGFNYSLGYCVAGDIPLFKIWDSQTDLYWAFSDNSNISSWSNNGTYPISYLKAFSSSPKIAVSQQDIELGDIVVGETGTQEVTISNTGEELLIGQIIATNGFYIDSTYSSFQIEPADSIIVEIALIPGQEIAYQGAITISSNSSINPELEITVSANGIMAHIDCESPGLQFNNVWKDHEVVKELTLFNDGTASLFIDSYSFSGDCYRVVASPSVIPADASDVLSIGFLPTDFREYNSMITIATNVGEFSLELTGIGYLLEADFTTAQDSVEIGNQSLFINNSQGHIIQYEWSFAELASSELENPSYLFPEIGIYEVTLQVSDQYFSDEISKNVIVYGVAEGELSTDELQFTSNYLFVPSDTLTLAIYSTRTADLLVDSFDFRYNSGAFIVLNPELPLSIAPNDSLVIEILFTPVISGNNIDFLEISTNDGTFSCFLEGTGIIVPPKAVENILIEQSDGNISLTWDPVFETILATPANISYYKIEASVTPKGPFGWIGISPTTTFTQFGVATYSERYFYRIIAVGDSGN